MPSSTWWDSQHRSEAPASPHIDQAVRLLAERSRAVFAECPEILSLQQRLVRLLPTLLTLPPIDDAGTLSRMYRGHESAPRVRREDE